MSDEEKRVVVAYTETEANTIRISELERWVQATEKAGIGVMRDDYGQKIAELRKRDEQVREIVRKWNDDIYYNDKRINELKEQTTTLRSDLLQETEYRKYHDSKPSEPKWCDTCMFESHGFSANFPQNSPCIPCIDQSHYEPREDDECQFELPTQWSYSVAIKKIRRGLISEFVNDLKKLPYETGINEELHQLTLKWEEKL